MFSAENNGNSTIVKKVIDNNFESYGHRNRALKFIDY